MAIVGQALSQWIKDRQADGSIPKNSRRVIIDIGLDDIVTIYSESYCAATMFDVNLGIAMKTHKAFEAKRKRGWFWWLRRRKLRDVSTLTHSTREYAYKEVAS